VFVTWANSSTNYESAFGAMRVARAALYVNPPHRTEYSILTPISVAVELQRVCQPSMAILIRVLPVRAAPMWPDVQRR